MTEIPVEPQPPGAATSATGRPQMLVIVNAEAGSAHEELVGSVLVRLRAEADVEVVTPADAEELAAALDVLGDRRLVLVGGDGSLHLAAQTLHDAGRLADVGPVGIVPLGTGNDLARTLGLPVDDPVAAAGVVLTGRPRPVEMLLDDDGGVVLNAAHAGVGAVATQRAGAVKRVLGKAAFPLGAVAAGVTETGWHLRVVVDGEELHDGVEKVLMAVVAVGGTIGAGAPVAPGADTSDGVAEVFVALATGALARIGFALDLRSGEHSHRDDVLTARGVDIEIDAADGEPFPLNVDGEVRESELRCRWRVLPRAWTVVVP